MTPPAAPAPVAGEFRELRLKQLVESPMNNRKHYDEKKLAELTESIRKNWILTPLLARPNGKFADFEIAAGHRRYRAALETGLDLPVPVMVREMSDAEFLEVLTIENLQREDVHPMDEALGYRELCEKHGRASAAVLR